MRSTVELADAIDALCDSEVADLVLIEIAGRKQSEQREFIRRIIGAVSMVSARELEQAMRAFNERDRGWLS